MEPKNDIDIRESTLRRTGKLLDILLINRTTNTNIIWATDSYKEYGEKYQFSQPIKPELITGKNSYLIQPRAAKTLAEQRKRTRDIAEVFTPLNIVEEMNNRIDESGQFSSVDENNWQDYVKAIKLEIACGEAPFIISRYDPTSHAGKMMPIGKRVGFLDKKLSVVSQYCSNKNDWLYWSKEACKASYGYEWQGDNILIARENILYSLIDYYKEKFLDNLSLKAQEQIATIISWNIFQMDGLKYVTPASCYDETETEPEQTSFLEIASQNTKIFECMGCHLNLPFNHNGIYVKIMDWESNLPIRFVDMTMSYKK